MKRSSYLSEVFECGDPPQHRKVFLTFDDGPSSVWTPKILDVLAQHGVLATFCVLGNRAADHPELLARMIAEGHEVANHTTTHQNLSKCEPHFVRREILKTNEIIENLCPDVPLRYFRAPYGEWTKEVIAEVENAGLTALHWSVDPRDWSCPGVDAIVDAVLTSVRPGSIVLMHDGSPLGVSDSQACAASRAQTVIALMRLIPALQERGFIISSLPPSRPRNSNICP
ncbi:chitooligosaccharide deacetylase NodB [Cupriavidus consociatus]|uniref:chitooligosaccharide deacetylase NodB n=1 Tax=Cupriavidus consociatus TaxID=2821357 RepID=UPI001AE29C30|nr:chitooligosaccharide deacetylase NodB [Cupriavidus sp. LEh21]MBP0625147.1 chitooligosaccharide deacetylase NodB [Cupriavidus sp. LEh25]MDK2661886.1 chitooligosaccharide deacetylase NodB [Cupriavidus sp. LEh21]